jgi:hypothetical protein
MVCCSERHDITMTWTLEQIEREWFGGQCLQMPREDVESAFAAAERVRGRDWVLGSEIDLGNLSLPGLGPRGGFSQFLRVYWFGKRIQTVAGVPGADGLIERLLKNDAAAESELTAIHLLRSPHPESDVEIEPEVMVGNRLRRPDFRIRRKTDSWTCVEVRQLNRSEASVRTQEVLRRIAGHVISVIKPFLLEVVFWREPTEGEEDDLVRRACEACQMANGNRQDVGDLASMIVKSGDPAVVVPSILPEDDGTRMALARSVVGPGEPNRQIVVRLPFADERAEDVLTAKAKQLPKDASGLVMVDAGGQPTAFDSWAQLVPRRFTPSQHTRVGGVLLFMTAITGTAQGTGFLPYLKLIPNSHARIALPAWISEVVEETRAETRRLTGRPD